MKIPMTTVAMMNTIVGGWLAQRVKRRYIEIRQVCPDKI